MLTRVRKESRRQRGNQNVRDDKREIVIEKNARKRVNPPFAY